MEKENKESKSNSSMPVGKVTKVSYDDGKTWFDVSEIITDPI